MKIKLYGLASMAAILAFTVHPAASAESPNRSLNSTSITPINLAYYYVSTRDRYNNKPKTFGDYYRSRHKYYDGSQRSREIQQQRRRSQVNHHQHRRVQAKPIVKPPETIAATGQPTFVFNPSRLNWGAYDANGQLIKYGKASGGKNYCADVGRSCLTPTGTFSVYRKGGADCKSSKYPLGKGGAPMGWCMFFKGGYAIHASNSVPGYNASHGCVRVVPSAARWLSREFMKIGTKVIVRSY